MICWFFLPIFQALTRSMMCSNEDSTSSRIPHNYASKCQRDKPVNHSHSAETIRHCGIGHCRPTCIQPCVNIKAFTALMCILACVNGSIVSSYLPAVLTTIEHRYELGSTTSGLIVSSYEIGASIAVIFVSFLGHHRHVPVILALGNILIGIGAIIFTLPHFIAPSYTDSLRTLSYRSLVDNETVCSLRANADCSTSEESVLMSGRPLYVSLFILAQTIIGIGSAPILTLGIAYVDNHISKKTSTVYLCKYYPHQYLHCEYRLYGWDS